MVSYSCSHVLHVTHSDRMWKADHKCYILNVILPTCLHGFVREVHMALLIIANSLRRLDGDVICAEEADHRGLEPGDRVILKQIIIRLGQELLRGFVLLEGSFPVGHINQASHHFSHYGGQTDLAGLLRWLSMRCFERNNKRIKGLVRGTRRPLAELANNIQMDIATRFTSYEDQSELGNRPPRSKLFSSTTHSWSRRETLHLSIMGITSVRDIVCFNAARILGVHFRANEWGHQTCGSVLTTIYLGRSRYCVVKRFFQIQHQSFAIVDWLSTPHYPYHPIRIVARVRELSPAEQSTHRAMISVDRIEPCQVAVMPDEDGVHYWMLRDSGTDRVNVRF